MKKIYLTAGLFLALASAFAQNKYTEEADKLFDSYQYVAAIDAYKQLAGSSKADVYVYKRIADSYYNIYNMEEASSWYAKAVEQDQDAETYYRYAQTLKSAGKYQEANAQMDKFSALMPNDQRAKAHLKNPNYIPALASMDKLFDLENVSINDATYSDFGPMLDNEGNVYFVSNRNTNNKKDKWIDQPYLDIYQATLQADGTLSEPVNVSELNSVYHDGPVTVSADGNTMFFARDGHSEGVYKKSKKSNSKIGQQGIYKATKVDGKWTNIQAVSFNSVDYSVSHPSLSKDGKTLYFASNMPGGLGDTDIWKVSVNGNSYGTPQNLGANVNSPEKEGFPFITEDNILYFSSTGRQGFGGLDIFKYDTASQEEAVNVGNPVNSKKDDFSFSLNSKYNTGFFASNREGSDDIYKAIPICKAQAIAQVQDSKTGNPIANAQVAILDQQSNQITSSNTDGQGNVGFPVECNTAYQFKVAKMNYETVTLPVPAIVSGSSTVKVAMEPTEVIITDSEVILKPIYFDFNKSNITAQGALELDKLVKVMEQYPSMVIFVKSHTDTKGSASYNLKLSDQRAQATVQYLISKGVDKNRISGKGFGFSEPKIDCGNNCTEEEDAQNRRSEFKIIK